ncbi:MAG: hypothetical protein H8E03_00505 [Pelagibacteraceae bacterium]|nr:hypothetical protein [Pelagibacteraceae bacterium]
MLDKQEKQEAVEFLNFLIARDLIDPNIIPKNDNQLESWFRELRRDIDKSEALLMWINRRDLPQA